jgi:beta-glucosidase/6-phospho-beta-glucosidase/beta-galactosidase
MSEPQGIFPTFFLSGFECSTFLWRDKKRRNLIEETQHHTHADEDYRLLHDLGIGVAREAVPWPLVDKGGSYDFSCIDPYIEAMNRHKVLPIWDLCHYGYPNDLDPFSDEFTERFAGYCRAAAEYVSARVSGPQFFTPINEITFFSYCGGLYGWIAPYLSSMKDSLELRKALCRADIAAVHAIREVVPEARMVHLDPIVQIVPPRDKPDLAGAAFYETYVDTFLAWDILCGKEFPEMGGAPEILDIVGVNVYAMGQKEYHENYMHESLEPDDNRIKPLCDLLNLAWQRYHRPMLIAETSGLAEGREEWLRDVVEEALAAVNGGMDLQGICLFPAVDMPDWHTGEWLHNGIYDLQEEAGDLRRVPYEPYVAELRRWQRELNRVTELDDDPLSDPVNLADIQEAARRTPKQPDQNWH